MQYLVRFTSAVFACRETVVLIEGRFGSSHSFSVAMSQWIHVSDWKVLLTANKHLPMKHLPPPGTIYSTTTQKEHHEIHWWRLSRWRPWLCSHEKCGSVSKSSIIHWRRIPKKNRNAWNDLWLGSKKKWVRWGTNWLEWNGWNSNCHSWELV